MGFVTGRSFRSKAALLTLISGLLLSLAGNLHASTVGETERSLKTERIDRPGDQPATKPAHDGSSPGGKEAPKVLFKGRVDVHTYLNIRTGPWGQIIGRFTAGDKVEVIGKSGDWYKINYKGKTAFVYSSYIDKTATKPAGQKDPVVKKDDDKPSGSSGSMQKRIVSEAHKLLGSTHFRSASVDYGNLACAQVVSTALKNAGVLSRVTLAVTGTMADLKARGWKTVPPPPKYGDVVTWNTGHPDGHIGIAIGNGQAISNSSSRRTPRVNSVYYYPISHILRHA